MLGFLATQDEAGLFSSPPPMASLRGVRAGLCADVRALFPARRRPGACRCVCSYPCARRMAFGAWLAGAIYDRVGFYAAAWWAGVAVNLAQLVLVGFLVLRQRRLGQDRPIRSL